MFMDIVRNSAFFFKYMDFKMPRMLSHDYKDMNFSVNGVVKDLTCVKEMANQVNVNTRIVETITGLYQEAAERDEEIKGQEDFVTIFEIMKKQK